MVGVYYRLPDQGELVDMRSFLLLLQEVLHSQALILVVDEICAGETTQWAASKSWRLLESLEDNFLVQILEHHWTWCSPV